ncbi:MAG TPA: hypothetical protein VHY58_03375 [Streptosporangiaceae bacterium]|jgi:hypothetical protein|nr:hypothetical protein [Streptosporangiaceae bacterium]
MKGEQGLLRLAEYLVGRACRRLPARDRDERYREWTAELPVILHDLEVRPGLRRAARMLGYALDTIRGTALGRDPSPSHGGHRLISRPLTVLQFPIMGAVCFLWYITIFGTSLEQNGSSCALWAIALYAAYDMRRRRAWAQISLIMVVSGALLPTWLLFLNVAQRAGWPQGPPWLTDSVRLVTGGFFTLGAGITLVRVIKAHRLRRRPQTDR